MSLIVNNEKTHIYSDFVDSDLYEPKLLNNISEFVKIEGSALTILLNMNLLKNASNQNRLELIKQIRPSATSLIEAVQEVGNPTTPNPNLSKRLKTVQFLFRFADQQTVNEALSKLTDKELENLMFFVSFPGNEQWLQAVMNSNDWNRVPPDTLGVVLMLAIHRGNDFVSRQLMNNPRHSEIPTRIIEMATKNKKASCVLL